MAHDGDCDIYGCEHELHSVDDDGTVRTRCRKCGQIGLYVPAKPSSGDARAQLWARVYAVEYELCRREHGGARGTLLLLRDGQTTNGEYARQRAREAADDAASDFDEHYLGGQR